MFSLPGGTEWLIIFFALYVFGSSTVDGHRHCACSDEVASGENDIGDHRRNLHSHCGADSHVDQSQPTP